MPTSALRPAPWGRLLWKESTQVIPLLLALAGLSILLHLLAAMLPGGPKSFSALAVLIPNLFAIGAPALLIGQEQESGTLRWLRTLPADWRMVTTVKLLIAAAGLVLLWCFSGLMLTVATALTDAGAPRMWQVRWFEDEIFYALAFSLQLLCCGFAVSWWLRWPVPSLFALVPIVFATTLGNSLIIGYLVRGRWDDLGRMPGSGEMLYAAFGLLVLSAALIAIAYGMARRALARPAGTGWHRRGGTITTTPGIYAYQPPRAMASHAPGPRLALLWQHTRQTASIVLPTFAVGLVATLLAAVLSIRDDRGPLAIIVAVVSTSILGSTVFVTDNLRDRHRFLAERGISAWRVWWTRQLVPATLALLIAVGLGAVVLVAEMMGSSRGQLGQYWWMPWSAGLAALCAFFVGQLTAQAVRRPAVAIMGAPLLVLMAIMAGSVVLSFYPEFGWTILLALPFLWLVTLRLCRRWLDGRLGAGYHARLVGWIGLAGLALIVPIALVRYATMPAAMPEWRAIVRTQAATAMQRAERPTNSWPVWFAEPRLFFPGRNAAASQPLSAEQLADIQQLTDQVLDGRAYLAIHGRWSSARVYDQLAARLRQQIGDPGQATEVQATEGLDRQTPAPHRLYPRLLRSMLISVQRLRSLESPSLYSSDRADRLEQDVVEELAQVESQKILGQQAWADLVAMLATADQRQHSRRLALLAAWHDYHFAADASPDFDRYVPSQPRQALKLEQIRTGRLIDVATRTSLQQLQSGLPAAGSPAQLQRIEQWALALPGWHSSVVPYLPTAWWRPATDRQIDQLRERAGVE